MELDFKTVKAISSPTRLQILRQVLNTEATPTKLSDELGKSKSTVSSHLEKLVESELVEKDKVEGRKRVVYRPTRKAKAIVEGRERKVKFSVASSVITTFAGLGFIGYSQFILAQEYMSAGAEKLNQDSGQTGNMGTMAMDKTAEVGPKAAQSSNDLMQMVSPENVFLFAGLGLLSISIFGILYGLTVKYLSS